MKERNRFEQEIELLTESNRDPWAEEEVSKAGDAQGPPRTDYTSMEEFKKRAKEQIRAGWTPILPKQVLAITPKFDNNFDTFAANVAYELRHYIVYRSDGGKFARGIVRATGELAIIHKELLQQKYPSGQKITIAAALYRRAHAVSKNRWMMSIKFGRVRIAPDASEKITASPEVTAQADKNLAEKILEWAEQAGNEPKWSGDRKKRIADWAALARQMGYPQFLELWHYNRDLVVPFVQYQNTNKRKAMTGGRLPPYDGTYMGMPWRVYPFKLIMAACKKKADSNTCYTHVANQLALSERTILSMINDVHKATAKLGPVNSMDPRLGSVTGSPEARYGNLAPFLRDLKQQLNDFRSLMGTFTKYTQAKPGFWDTF